MFVAEWGKFDPFEVRKPGRGHFGAHGNDDRSSRFRGSQDVNRCEEGIALGRVHLVDTVMFQDETAIAQ